MNRDESTPLDTRAAELRRLFDQSFAEARAGVAAPARAFLAVGIGGNNYALRLSEVAELFVDKRVVPLPSYTPDLIGIASVRGALVAVYDLRVLLGYAPGQAQRWLALAESDMPVALAFDRLDGYLDIPAGAVVPAAGTSQARPYLTETVSAAGIVRPIVNIASILETIRLRMRSMPSGER